MFVLAELPVVSDTMGRDCHCPAALAAPVSVFRTQLAEKASEAAHFDLNEPARHAGRWIWPQPSRPMGIWRSLSVLLL